MNIEERINELQAEAETLNKRTAEINALPAPDRIDYLESKINLHRMAAIRHEVQAIKFHLTMGSVWH